MTEFASKKLLKIILWSIALFLLLYLLYVLSGLLVVIIISILLSFIFDPFVKSLEKEGFSRFGATFVIFIILGLFIYLTLSFFIPMLLYQMNSLIETLHVYSLHDQIVNLEREIYKFLPIFVPGELSQKIEDLISGIILNSIDKLTSLVSSVVSVVAILLIVPFITFFFLKDSQHIFKNLVRIVPNNYFEMSYWILKKVSLQLGRFVRAWIFDASFVGFLCGVGFYVLGIENAIPLGVIAGIGHLVPYLGPVIGAVPAIIISIMQFGDASMVPFIILIIIAVYTIDNGIVQPYVFAKSVDMHPVIIILLIIAGSQLFGVLGMLLAIPLATVTKTAVKEIYFAFKNYKIARL
jgi:predicted PurR-regulated permease PerM